jgi:hypothetical protein
MPQAAILTNFPNRVIIVLCNETMSHYTRQLSTVSEATCAMKSRVIFQVQAMSDLDGYRTLGLVRQASTAESLGVNRAIQDP